ncbi:MAG: hypothetical protein DMF21_02240 [Verrucomicrobia bacterium]|nr:MAG: hypothetical protein DME62_04715 [Verrucomicrobiota bacterium]PYL82494.1 MAG: hypothetical protein DMF21_02240 [Verrucomicrobiota bacterium]
MIHSVLADVNYHAVCIPFPRITRIGRIFFCNVQPGRLRSATDNRTSNSPQDESVQLADIKSADGRIRQWLAANFEFAQGNGCKSDRRWLA